MKTLFAATAFLALVCLTGCEMTSGYVIYTRGGPTHEPSYYPPPPPPPVIYTPPPPPICPSTYHYPYYTHTTVYSWEYNKHRNHHDDHHNRHCR